MARFAIEKSLLRIALITPKWKQHRSKCTSGKIAFLYYAGAFDNKTRARFTKFSKRINKCVHETRVDKFVAAKLLAEAEQLRPVLDAVTTVVLAEKL